jgi:hypothetical protein
MSGVEKFRVTVRMKSGGTLDLGTYDTLTEAVAAAEEFKAERDDARWTMKQRAMGEAKNSFVFAIGHDGVTDPSIVVSKVEARATRDVGDRDWYRENKRGREL